MNTTALSDSPAQRLLDGTARLLARRRPGETFSSVAIAEECGVHHRTIQNIERKAIYRMAHGLRRALPELFTDRLSDASIKALFARLSPDPEKAKGGINLRGRQPRHFQPLTRGGWRPRLSRAEYLALPKLRDIAKSVSALDPLRFTAKKRAELFRKRQRNTQPAQPAQPQQAVA